MYQTLQRVNPLPNLVETDRPRFIKAAIAEFIGAFFLMLAALLAPPGIGFLMVGLIVLVMVVAIGDVSGAHLNPAVTTGLVVARKFPLLDGLLYIPLQFVGGLSAILLMRLLGRPLPTIVPGSAVTIFEFLGAFLLVFVVIHVTVRKVPETGSALGIGAALAVGALIAGTAGGGVINPALGLSMWIARVIDDGIFALIPFVLAPLVAGIVAGLLGSYLGSRPKLEGTA